MNGINTKKLLLAEIERLSQENKLLFEHLREARKSIEAIKTGNIDAVVIANEKDVTIFTEKSTDQVYRILIEKMNEGAVALTADGTILYCNACFAGMVNHPLQKVIGENFTNFVHESSEQRFEELLHLANLSALREQVYVKIKDGGILPTLLSINSFPLDNIMVLSVILTDLSQHFKSQEELRQKTIELKEKNVELESANSDLTSFTYVSSHDLQEPLRKIQNFVTCILLEDEKNLSETGKGYFRRLGLTAKRMQSLIDDLLIYAKAKDSGQNFEKTDLCIITNDVIKDLEEIILQKEAKLDTTGLGYGRVIRFEFRQLIYNLMTNSLKFCKPGTKPHIKIQSNIINKDVVNDGQSLIRGNYCHIIYTDNGIGFDPQYSLRIFEVFQRLYSQEEYKGTGIGLAICKRIVDNHKGVITASGKLTGGARFDIYIPEN